MDILWVAATPGELVGVPPGARALITGPGPICASVELAHELSKCVPDRIIALGIAGAYPNSGLQLLDVVRVDSDCFLDIGAETDDGFRDLADLGIPGIEIPGRLDASTWGVLSGLPGVRGGTCSTCTGTKDTAWRRSARAQIESMEGAAWASSARKWSVPYNQIRAISNFCGPRDRSSWKIPEALEQLKDKVQRIWSA